MGFDICLDCLHLNLWTPLAETKTPHVMSYEFCKKIYFLFLTLFLNHHCMLYKLVSFWILISIGFDIRLHQGIISFWCWILLWGSLEEWIGKGTKNVFFLLKRICYVSKRGDDNELSSSGVLLATFLSICVQPPSPSWGKGTKHGMWGKVWRSRCRHGMLYIIMKCV